MSRKGKNLPKVDVILKMYEHESKVKDREHMDVCTWAYKHFDNEIKKLEKWRDFCKPENFLQACKEEEKVLPQPVRKKKIIVIKKKQQI